MNKKLMSGYTAYITADEYGAAVMGKAPATTPLLVISVEMHVGPLTSLYGHC